MSQNKVVHMLMLILLYQGLGDCIYHYLSIDIVNALYSVLTWTDVGKGCHIFHASGSEEASQHQFS